MRRARRRREHARCHTRSTGRAQVKLAGETTEGTPHAQRVHWGGHLPSGAVSDHDVQDSGDTRAVTPAASSTRKPSTSARSSAFTTVHATGLPWLANSRNRSHGAPSVRNRRPGFLQLGRRVIDWVRHPRRVDLNRRACHLPSATSRCAMTAVVLSPSTRGMHPRASCPARKLASTANSELSHRIRALDHRAPPRTRNRPCAGTCVAICGATACGDGDAERSADQQHRDPHAQRFGEGQGQNGLRTQESR